MKLAKFHDEPEIFHSLQGEGVSIGLPATFVRASLCNLHCRWCDTEYTWNFEGTPWPHDFDGRPEYRKHRREDVIIEVEPAKVAALVRQHPPRRVIFTGGEPLLQQAAWIDVMRELRADGSTWVFEVETNGTLTPAAEFEEMVSQFNVSPKLSNSGNKAALRTVPAALEHFARSPKAWFKFVVTQPADLGEIDELVAQHGIPAERILLMPEGRTPAELDHHAREIAELCIRRGWRYGDRLHIRLWGDQRGV